MSSFSPFKIIASIVGILLAIWLGLFLYSKYLNTDINNAKIIELEKQNIVKDEKIRQLLEQKESDKILIQTAESEKETLKLTLESLSQSLNRVRVLQVSSRKEYDNKIKDIPNDNTDIFNRCLRACEESRRLGEEFACSRNFCNELSSSGSANTRK